MKQPRRYPRYGSLPKPNGKTRPIARVLAEAKARGETMTDDDLARFFAISAERVARHRRIIGS